jgi:aryl-alcohol dehydrogenase-like predicted oxidoreductase
MITRRIGETEVSAIGLGCMNLSHAYGTPPRPKAAEALLLRALDLGVTHFDTAALYGFGANEELVGRVLSPLRNQFYLASKCGMTGVDGKRVIDGRPETILRTCDEALKRLRTDHIDLYYLHRWDKQVPVEESVGALSRLVEAGKVISIGLSEVSADTLRRAHAVHPVGALQTEYSLWTRNPEIAVLETCRELGTAFVAFSPLGRGFLTGAMRDVSGLEAKDIRRNMPRFEADNFERNLPLLDGLQHLAEKANASPAQLALAWLLAREDNILPIPGTTSIPHLEENMSAGKVRLDSDLFNALDTLINRQTVVGARYNGATQAEIDTEEF